MEAYKTVCPDCGYTRFWVGYKHGFGKTEEQLRQMHEDAITCAECGFKNAKTVLDRESQIGQVFAESTKALVKILSQIRNP